MRQVKGRILGSLVVLMSLSLVGCSQQEMEDLSRVSGYEPILAEDGTIDPIKNTIKIAMTLPGFLDRNEAETTPDPALEQVLIDHYQLDPQQCKETQYYYNYLDLNDDGAMEIFVLLLGPYTTTESGSSAALVLQGEEGYYVEKSFTNLYMPFVVSNQTNEGWHDLVLVVGEGGRMDHYVVLRYENNAYGISTHPVEQIESIDGTIYLCNDLEEDQKNGNFLILGDGIK